MGTESEKKLTINDPVDAQTLKRMGEIQTRRLQLGEMMVDLEQEKVKVLVEVRRLDDERSKLFATVLSSRGLGPNVPVEVDPQTGKISLLNVPNGQAPEAPAPEAAPPQA
jgi:hypothetical protein